MTKKIITLTLLTPLIYTACSSNKPNTNIETPETVSTQINNLDTTTVNYNNDNTKIKKQGIMHISSFMGTLKPTLMSLIKSDPSFKTAMGGCTSMAQSMTNDYNAVSPNTKIRRTALKYRNEKNKPDATDTIVMEHFLASNDFKEPLVVEMPTHYRVYKALDMKQPCLACHGTNISTDLKQMLISSYPTDLATHFKLGEFRGVVVAEVQK